METSEKYPEKDPKVRSHLEPPAEAERVALRCPYCHDDIAVGRDAWVACIACLSRHHSACWEEGAACASCGKKDAIGEAPRPLRGTGRLLLAGGIGGLCAVGGLAAALFFAKSAPPPANDKRTPAPVAVALPKPVEVPKPVEPPRVIDPPQIVEPPKPVEAPKPAEPPAPAVDVKALYARANDLFVKQEYDEGDIVFAEAFANDPRCKKAWDVVLREGLARKGTTLAALDRAIEVDPGVAMFFHVRALVRFQTVLMGTGRLGKDVVELYTADLTRALDLDSTLAFTWACRGHLGGRLLADPDGARADLDRALELDPGLTAALAWRGYLRNGKDPEGARADFARALEIDPKCCSAFHCRAEVERGHLSEYGRAIEDYTRAIELAPRCAYPLFGRAMVKQALGDLEGAIADVTRGLELAPLSAGSYYSRAKWREVRGDGKGALADFERFLELADPEAPERRDARDSAARLRRASPSGDR